MQPQPKKNTAIIGIVAIVILAALVVGTIALKPKSETTSESDSTTSTAQTENTEESTPSTAQATGDYKNGTYEATGSYTSPGGTEEIDVTITIVDDKVTDSSVAPQAATRESMEYQDEFANGYKDLITGKDIDEIQLSKVSGSSLTSRGFNQALEQIKSQAKV